MNTSIGDKLFQNIPRRVASFAIFGPGMSKNQWMAKITRPK